MTNYSINNGFLLNNERVFLPSTNINIFPCSRRGQSQTGSSIAQYDPEARLNTERTNRLHTAVNGFTDRFIISFDKTSQILKFVLAGYSIDAKSFDPAIIASNLGVETGTIYAYLGLHGGVSLSTADYFTEILYRQAPADEVRKLNYLDVPYDNTDFFVGVSFTADEEVHDTGVTPCILPLFSYNGSSWELVQASLLPKIEHGDTENSIKFGTVTELTANEIWLGDSESASPVPALELAHLASSDSYQLRFKFGQSISIKEE